jgi:hypothetical protein
MRNHLAEEVLSKKMLYLLQVNNERILPWKYFINMQNQIYVLLHAAICRLRFVFWRMKIIADATISIRLVYHEIWNAIPVPVLIRLHRPESQPTNRSM